MYRAAAGIVATWDGQGFLLLRAEHITGPWYDLVVVSSVVLPANHPAPFFRLVCD